MKRIFLTLCICLITFNSFAQDASAVQNPLDTLYDGGSDAYGTLLRQTLTTPRSMLGSKKAGFVIFEISVQSTGEVSAKMMTKFNDDTEKSVVRSIQATVAGWIVHPTDYKVYQPVLFNSFIVDQESVSKRLNMFPEKFEYPILPLTTLTMMSTTRSVRRLSSSPPGGQTTRVPRSLTNKTDQKKASGSLDVLITEVDRMKERLVTSIEKGKTKKAYNLVSEILVLNPFDKTLIQQRRRLEKELGQNEYRVYDILWLQALDKMGLTQND